MLGHSKEVPSTSPPEAFWGWAFSGPYLRKQVAQERERERLWPPKPTGTIREKHTHTLHRTRKKAGHQCPADSADVSPNIQTTDGDLDDLTRTHENARAQNMHCNIHEHSHELHNGPTMGNIDGLLKTKDHSQPAPHLAHAAPPTIFCYYPKTTFHLKQQHKQTIHECAGLTRTASKTLSTTDAQNAARRTPNSLSKPTPT